MNVMTRLLVAFDAGSVSGATVRRTLGGWRVRRFARAPLPEGALTPAPLEANVVQTEAVHEALARVAQGLDAAGFAATLVLPAGLSRILLLQPPRGVDVQEFARFRLAASLPYAASEAVVDVLPTGAGRILAAAVRRRIVEEYEAAAAAAGLARGRVDLAPFAALQALLRDAPGRGAAVDVILGDVATDLAASAQGTLRLYRSRRRDPGPDEAERLRAEVERTAVLAGDGAAPLVRVVGTGARTLIGHLLEAGVRAEAGWSTAVAGLPLDAAEMAWLGATVA